MKTKKENQKKQLKHILGEFCIAKQVLIIDGKNPEMLGELETEYADKILALFVPAIQKAIEGEDNRILKAMPKEEFFPDHSCSAMGCIWGPEEGFNQCRSEVIKILNENQEFFLQGNEKIEYKNEITANSEIQSENQEVELLKDKFLKICNDAIQKSIKEERERCLSEVRTLKGLKFLGDEKGCEITAIIRDEVERVLKLINQ